MADDPCDWQSCQDYHERGRHIMLSGKWADCSFLVGSEPNQSTVKGHKLILAMASPVFEVMFYGTIAENKEQQSIPIVDVRPEVFNALLEYIYTNNVNIKSFNDACELYYASKKYMLPRLTKKCVFFIIATLSPKRALRAYEFSKFYEELHLMEKSLQIIRNQTKEILADESFNEADISTVIMVFDQSYLNIQSELDLFEAADKYNRKHMKISPFPKITAEKQNSTQTSKSPKSEIENALEGANAGADVRSLFVFGQSSTNHVLDIYTSPSHFQTVSLPSMVEIETTNSPDKKKALEDMYLKEKEIDNSIDISKKPAIIRKPTIRDAVKRIRFLTLNPQQFSEGLDTFNSSYLISQSEALAILLNISSAKSKKLMPEGFSTSKELRNKTHRNPYFCSQSIKKIMHIHPYIAVNDQFTEDVEIPTLRDDYPKEINNLIKSLSGFREKRI